MDDELRDKIIGHLDSTVDIVRDRVREKARLFFNSEIISGGNGTASPFSKTLFPQIKLASLVERSYSASIGSSFNYIARDLARHNFGNGELEYVVAGTLPASTAALIGDIIDDYRGENHTSPDTPTELERVSQSLQDATADEERVERTIKSDVFFIDDEEFENYIEIKTPMPNYDTCKAVKNRILTLHALRHEAQKVRARVAFPHNPNGARGEYAWPPTRYFLDPKHDWAHGDVPLMGAGFWNYLGGSPSTFSDLIGCCEDVFSRRNDEMMEMLDAVAFGLEEM